MVFGNAEHVRRCGMAISYIPIHCPLARVGPVVIHFVVEPLMILLPQNLASNLPPNTR